MPVKFDSVDAVERGMYSICDLTDREIGYVEGLRAVGGKIADDFLKTSETVARETNEETRKVKAEFAAELFAEFKKWIYRASCDAIVGFTDAALGKENGVDADGNEILSEDGEGD